MHHSHLFEGMLDYPKIVTHSAGLVMDKWDVCHKILAGKHKPKLQANGSVAPKEVILDEGSNLSVHDEFVASVVESASKLILHHAWLTEVKSFRVS